MRIGGKGYLRDPLLFLKNKKGRGGGMGLGKRRTAIKPQDKAKIPQEWRGVEFNSNKENQEQHIPQASSERSSLETERIQSGRSGFALTSLKLWIRFNRSKTMSLRKKKIPRRADGNVQQYCEL